MDRRLFFGEKSLSGLGWGCGPQRPLTVSVIAEVRWVKDEKQQVYDIGFQFVF
jgi:hypothetical protein